MAEMYLDYWRCAELVIAQHWGGCVFFPVLFGFVFHRVEREALVKLSDMA